MIRDNFVQVIYEHASYEFPSITLDDVERVMRNEGYDVEPVKVIYVQSLSNAWKHMLFTAESSKNYAPMTVSELQNYNRICYGNLRAGAGELFNDDIKEMPSIRADRKVFKAVFSHEWATVEERDCNLY